MDPDRYRRLMALFDALCDLPADERAPRLEAARAEDAALADELALMLAADDAPDPLAALSQPGARCPTCGESWPGDVEFCPRHGARLLPAASGDPLVGVMLDGRYRIDGVVGRGGMAVVYRAHQVNVGRDVAVKVLRVDLQGHAAVARRFEREARIIAGLRHPNTLKLIDFGHTAGGALYIVNPLLQGRPLDAVLAEDGPLGADGTRELLRQVSGALAEAHGLGIVHRDLKPANIYVEQVGGGVIYKILDFGIAKWTDGLHRTDTGLTIGTPAYMSPEQISGDARLDGRSDIYSLGVVAYACLTGELPWAGITPANAPHKHLNEAPRPFAALGPGRSIPPGLERLVRSMLAKDPAGRPNDAVALRAALDAAAGDSRPPTTGRRRLIGAVAGALVAMAALALGWPRTEPSPRPNDASAAADDVADAAIVDATLPDAALPDAALPDATLPDTALDAAPDAGPDAGPDAAPAPAAPARPRPEPARRPAVTRPPPDAGYQPAPGLY